MNKDDIDKSFVSVYDQFLFEFDATHAKSPSQLKEIKKFQRIFALRDEATTKSSSDKIWDAF